MGNAFDPMATFNDAQNMAYGQQERYALDRARRRAGGAMKTGDITGATGELYGAGDFQGAQSIEDQQGQQQDRQFRQQQQEMQLRQQDAARKAEFMKRAALALRDIPPEQRGDAFKTKVGPALVQLGMNPQDLNGVEDHLDDASLTAFAGEMDKHLQVINRGGGGYDVVDSRTGQAVRSVEPTQRPVIVGNGGVALDPDTGQPMYANPKTFAPQRPRSGGGRGGSAKPKPWERAY